MKKNYLLPAICLFILVAAGGGYFIYRYMHRPLPVVDILNKGRERRDFVQASFYTITGAKDGIVVGTGYARYSTGSQIVRVGSLEKPLMLSIKMNTSAESASQKCLKIMSQPVPFKQEIFIAGTGFFISNNASIQGKVATVAFNHVDECAVVLSH